MTVTELCHQSLTLVSKVILHIRWCIIHWINNLEISFEC